MGYNREIERSQYNVHQCSFHGTKEDTCVTVDVTPKVWNLFFMGTVEMTQFKNHTLHVGKESVLKPKYWLL
jgi:hypothetical protein